MAEKDTAQVDVTFGKGSSRIHVPTGRIIINNFFGGLAWGVGTVLGATVIVGLIVLVLSKLNSVPIIGDFFSGILQQIQSGVR